MSGVKSIIKKVLGETGLVLGWTAARAGGAAPPACFQSAEEADRAVFDATCVHNLAVYLPRLKDRTVGIVAKACDARSIVQLIQERAAERGRIKVIGVKGCGGTVDVRGIWRRFGYGAEIKRNTDSLIINGFEADRAEFLNSKCLDCRDAEPVIYDELFDAGGRIVADGGASTVELPGAQPASESTGKTVRVSAGRERETLRAEFTKMTPQERRTFWREQYSRCIRCYACREACPMCFCRDVCIMQTTDPHWTGGSADAHDAEMMQMIRVSHLAGRCTGCGECERACPAGIPLMLLMEEQNRAVEELFGYQAGADPEARPPLLTFSIEGESWSEE